MDSLLLADVGGTYLRYRLGSGEAVRSAAKGWEEQLIGVIATHPQIRRVAIAFAGQVSQGQIRSAPNVPLAGGDFPAELRRRFPYLQIAIENDLKCAALAYQHHLGSDSVAVLYAGSGIGSAVISEGRIVRGSQNLAGEIGHIRYRNAPFSCGCGKTDCLELFGSGSGIEKHRHFFQLGAGTPDVWLTAGSPKEREVAAEIVEALAFAASLMITLYNPSYLVIGGGIFEHNPRVRDHVKERAASGTFPPAWKGCRLVDGDLSDAPLVGAGLLFGGQLG